MVRIKCEGWFFKCEDLKVTFWWVDLMNKL